ncbi:alpha/beta fold hydrolase [Rhodococcus sp. 114MFTsu3.1]|uniref:alpha/beta fold hydrolase n=1 Tax=Rhodococcus sp. 114MFTsu3.1 TaxID=1172184 RepID=UPI00037335DF|nr:alpha/beta hydrolase [Rhodococcus sp. 114MFTsu3.1]
MHTFVLVPGAGGDARYWSRLEPELRDRGHDVVAVTLPASDPNAGLAEYADVVVDAVGDRRGVTVVGQSLGGFTAPLVAPRVDASMIVLLNAMAPTPGEPPGEWWEATGFGHARAVQAERDGRDLDTEDLVADVFLHDVPADVVAELGGTAPDQSDGPFALPWPLTAWPDIPTRCLQGIDDRFFPVEFQRRVVRDRLGIEVDEMPGGHLVALSRPAELADRLDRYRAELVGDPR